MRLSKLLENKMTIFGKYYLDFLFIFMTSINADIIQKITIGTHGTPLSFSLSLTLFEITLIYGNANLTNKV